MIMGTGFDICAANLLVSKQAVGLLSNGPVKYVGGQIQILEVYTCKLNVSVIPPMWTALHCSKSTCR